MRRNLLFVNHTDRISGAEKSLLSTVAALDPDDYRVGVAAPIGDLAEALRAEGIPHYPVRLCRFQRTWNPTRLLLYWLAWRRGRSDLTRVARGGEFQILHANNTTSQLSAGVVARSLGAKSVWHVRDLGPLRPVGGLCGRSCDAIVAVSKAVAIHVQEQLPQLEEVHVIHNGIDAEGFASGADGGAIRRELAWPEDALVFTMVAQIVPWKRHEDFLMAFHGVLKSHARARALIVGSDLFGQHANLVARLRDLVHNLGLANHLAFVGQRDDVADLIAASDMVVIPSQAEPFGRVALEAMALSKPVVGTNAGGLPEVVEDGSTGLLVPPEDPTSLGAALRRLADDAGLRQRLGDAGAVLVRRQFTPARCASQIEAVYERLLRDEGEDSP